MELRGYDVAAPAGWAGTGALWLLRDSDGNEYVGAPLAMDQKVELARAQTLLAHPVAAVVSVVELVPMADGRLMVVMERVSGLDLVARRPRDEKACRQLVFQIAQALAGLHDLGLAHGDLSPANVMVNRLGNAVLIDVLADPALTLGTPGFRAPERERGGPSTPMEDSYSWGKIAQYLEVVPELAADACDPDPAQRPTAREILAQLDHGTARTDVKESGVGVEFETREDLLSWEEVLSPPGEPTVAGVPDLMRNRVLQETTQELPKRGFWRAKWRQNAGQHSAAKPRRMARRVILSGFVAVLLAGAGSLWFWLPGAAEAEKKAVTPCQRVTALLKLRDKALTELAPDQLAAVNAPASEAAQADAQLLAQLQSNKLRVTGLNTQAKSCRVHSQSGPITRVDFLLVQARYQRCQQQSCQQVPAPQTRKLQVELVGEPGRIQKAVTGK